MAPPAEFEDCSPDPSAVFACALSLWHACKKRAEDDPRIILSEIFNGMDQLMREVMRIGILFETWACKYIAFAELDDVWSYLLEDHFGEACLAKVLPTGLAQFDAMDCLRVALHLCLPVRIGGDLPIPVDTTAANPQAGAGFKAFRIQTIRELNDDGEIVPFTADDEPFDGEFGPPYYGLYGVDQTGDLEHIADRADYLEAVALAEKLAPGIGFPKAPTFTTQRSPSIEKD